MVVSTGVDIDRPLLHSSYMRALQIVCVVAVGVMGPAVDELSPLA